MSEFSSLMFNPNISAQHGAKATCAQFIIKQSSSRETLLYVLVPLGSMLREATIAVSQPVLSSIAIVT